MAPKAPLSSEALGLTALSLSNTSSFAGSRSLGHTRGLSEPVTPRPLLRAPTSLQTAPLRSSRNASPVGLKGSPPGTARTLADQEAIPASRINSKVTTEQFQLKPPVVLGIGERYRYRVSEHGPWDLIAEHAAMIDSKNRELSQGGGASAVVLVYHEAFNPFHFGHVDVLRRARKAVEAFPKAAVIGALVTPYSEEALKRQGIDEQERLPFALRRDAVRCVVEAAEQARWIAVDPCMQGNKRHVSGPITPYLAYLAEYAKCRLHRSNWEVRVLEVRAQEPLDVVAAPSRNSDLRVSLEVGGARMRSTDDALLRQSSSFKAITRVVVDIAKQEHFHELLSSAVRQPFGQTGQLVLERLCGTAAAGLIREWAGRNGKARRRSVLSPA